MRAFAAIVIFLAMSVATASAQTELSFYGGAQSAPHSGVSGTDPGGIGPFDFTAGWEGRPFAAPPYYGVRLTWWQSDAWGWGVDFSHDKVYADAGTLSANGLTVLEFSDGLNVLTFNGYRKWDDFGGAFVPYVGAGIGVSLPHVEFDSGAGRTFEYQLGGPAVSVVAGARYPLGDRWSLFGEYKGTYSINNVDLVSGGDLSTSIVTNSFNLGATFGF
jgi:lipid A oxidase